MLLLSAGPRHSGDLGMGDRLFVGGGVVEVHETRNICCGGVGL